MIVTNKHSSSNVQKIFAKKQNSFVLLSEQPIDITKQEYNEDNIYIVDKPNNLSSLTLKIIFERSKNGIVVFVNTTHDKKEFNSIIVNKVLSYFDNIDCFYTCIIYFDHDFPVKHVYTTTSDLVKVTKSEFDINHSGLLYIGQYGTSGYATAAKGYIAEYVLKGVDISWQPLRFDDSKNDPNYYVDALAESALNKKLDKTDLTIVHSTPDIWHNYLTENTRYVGYCTWETNKLPTEWVNHINLMPEVWVPSHFNKESFINSGVTSKIAVVPHVWHPQPLYSKEEVNISDSFGNKIPKGKYTFYSIGELNFRKGIQDLVSVFDKLNDYYPNTQLILKIHYKGYAEKNIIYCIDEIRKLTSKLGTSVYLVLNNINNRELLALHSFGDCYVSLHKGEGFGLTIFDAYHRGKDIVTTGYSAPKEFLGIDYHGLVNYKLDKVSGMESFSTNYSSDQEWAYPDLDHAYELMKSSYEKKYSIH